MKTISNKIFSAASLTLLLFSCKPEIDVPVPSKGQLDVTNYVAIGNSLTAGYADNALYYDAQTVSYPNLLAQQFKLIGGGNFRQPLVPQSSVGIGSMQNARMILAPSTDCMGGVSLAPKFVAQSGDLNIFGTNIAAQGPFNNMGVPGLKSITTVYPGYGDFTKGLGNFNPFFTRMTADPQNASILSEAAAQNPSFFTLSIGNDDVMAYALSGGTADVITPSSGAAGVGFDGSFDLAVNTLTANGAKGALANIPEIDDLPYFTTIPYNGLLLDNANAAALTAAYAPLGISFQQGYNAFIIEDGNAPGGMRKINQGEYVLLSVPQDSLKCGGWGSMKPIPNQYVLTVDEVTLVNKAINDYNNKIRATAIDKALAWVDMNGFMKNAKKGILYNGVNLSAQFVVGGVFSLDGVHLTPLGNALLANEFISSINIKYSIHIPQIDATKYKGVVFP